MKSDSFSAQETNPLKSIEEWEDDVLKRYPTADEPARAKEDFRNYTDPARDTVREFYRLNHQYQTHDFVMKKRAEFLQFNRKQLTVWEAMEFLNTLVDDSDPDIELDQLQHLLQTAEAIRRDGKTTRADRKVDRNHFHDHSLRGCARPSQPRSGIPVHSGIRGFYFTRSAGNFFAGILLETRHLCCSVGRSLANHTLVHLIKIFAVLDRRGFS